MSCHKKSKCFRSTPRSVGRRTFLSVAGGLGLGTIVPYFWIPKNVQAKTAGTASAKHLVYIRLSGGFRFPTAFNANVAAQFNPFGLASGVSGSPQWGVSKLLEGEGMWLTEERAEMGLQTVTSIAQDIAVMPCVDHEPLSGSADGNHQTGLERFLTGYVGGEVGIFTMLNYGLSERVQEAADEGKVLLPAVIMGESGMGRGNGAYAAYRPPVLRGDELGRFAGGAGKDAVPPWARQLSQNLDVQHRDTRNANYYAAVDAYLQSRAATRAYQEILASDALNIENQSGEVIDGISNNQLEQIFGTDRAARDVRLALRLFHFGCPAVYLDQGGYDYHSDEDERLPDSMQGLNHLLSGLHFALKRMQHPDGGSYWDHTIVACGSEFSRSARGSRFNSAGGSDHGGDNATRWMSMPFMGGPIRAAGRMIGSTNRDTLAAEGQVYSYRSVMKTMMDALGAKHDEFFVADPVFDELFV